MADAIVLGSEVGPDRETVAVADGIALAYSCRDPEKTTPNEDTLAVVRYGADAAVFAVADGAGGLPAGKRASEAAVKTLIESIAAVRRQETSLRTAVMNGIEAANRAVLELANGSATTLTVVTLEGRTARTYQVGDSEALIVGQRGFLRAQTTAHSPTGFAVEAGFLDQREALHHAERHIVSNFVGTPEMTIDVGATVTLRVRDTILLASDGLTDNVHLDEIVETIRKGPPEAAIDRLTRLAGQRMQAATDGNPSKPDDLSVILVRLSRRAGRGARRGLQSAEK